jgi:hypothetical protein
MTNTCCILHMMLLVLFCVLHCHHVRLSISLSEFFEWNFEFDQVVSKRIILVYDLHQ